MESKNRVLTANGVLIVNNAIKTAQVFLKEEEAKGNYAVCTGVQAELITLTQLLELEESSKQFQVALKRASKGTTTIK